MKGERRTHYWCSACGHCAFKAPVKAKYRGAQLCWHNICKHGLQRPSCVCQAQSRVLTAKLHDQNMHQASLRSSPCYLLHTCMHMHSGKSHTYKDTCDLRSSMACGNL